jgi:hypothetical protein
MRQLAIVLAAFAVLAVPARAPAVFHVGHIAEVMSGVGIDPTAQYVEIRMDAGFQNAVQNSVLSAFNCDGTVRRELLLVPGNVTNQGNGVRWIMATKDPIGGISPDFMWDTADGNIEPSCGMVCWGAPGVTVPALDSWSHEDPNDYVDCVAYGGYTGPTKTADPDADGVTSSSGTPTALTPGGGTFSLTRVASTNNNATDFALDCPSPTNNAGAPGTFGPCTPPPTTTTTTIAGATTTTTTVPGVCSDVASCRTALAAALPSPTSAPNAKTRKAAIKLGKLFTTAGKALDRAAGLTGKKHDKRIRKARVALGKLLKKAQAADRAGTLGVPLAPLESAVSALLATIG